MATRKSSQPWKAGDRVRIRYSEFRGRIVEERGPLGPGGILIYRVRIPHKPKPIYIEVREDQLIEDRLAPAKVAPNPTPPKLEPFSRSTTLAPAPQPPKIKSKNRRTGL
jgi:hypothetical protein